MKMVAKAKIKLIFFVIFSVLTGIIFSSFLFSIFDDKGVVESKNSQASLIEVIAPKEEKFQYFYTNKEASAGPKVSAKAFLVGDLDTGEVIVSKNQDKKLPIASVSKLMTAVVATEIAKPEDTTTISKKALDTYGTNGALRLGEKIQISDLLYPLLLESSNDAAEAVALHFDREDFISKMNQKADGLKMSGTSFEDPSGLSPNNQSTVSDIFKLTGYIAKQQPSLIDITTKRSYSNKKHSWSNISQFLGKDGYIGGKSGYTDAARQTVVSLFSLPLGQNTSRPIAITLLGSTDRKRDVESILKYLEKNIYYGGKADANTDWVEEKVGIPSIKDPNFVMLAFAGDIMLDRGVESSVIRNFGGNYSMLFEKEKGLSDIFKKADIAFANLEGPASDQGADQKNLYSFRMDPSVIPALRGVGLSVLSVANNHAGDWGRLAYADTLTRLKENEIFYTGGGQNKTEAETPIIIEKYGMKIGYLAFSDVGPNWMEAGAEKAGVLLANNPRFDEIINTASKQVDYLVVSFHFGDEYKEKHNQRQETLAHRAIDNGAKIVIGHHPHVTQDTETYKNGFIAYSLGNFIFDQSWSKPTMQGMILEIKLNRDGSMVVQKNATQLNSAFQLDKITPGKEEIIKLEEIQTQ
jgi:poly-gamma-glutamate synthesis protein (capsule biosynthesis protein)